jgi:hypothetical protein
MALTNPTKYVSVQRLARFEQKLAAKYQTQAITAITGLTSLTVEAALAELLGKIQAIPSSIIPKGTRTFAQLVPSTDLAAGSLGFMWNISDGFTTTSDFAEGAGHIIPAGANVYVANVGTAAEPSYKYDVFAGMYDLSGYALKSEMAITDVSGDATKKNIQLKSGLSQDVIVAHQDISGKADKDTDAVTGNFAIFDANGNPVDGDCKPADFQAAGSYKTTQSAVSDPTASGTAVEFIATISQDANGEITATKKTVQNVSASTSGVGGQAGLMAAADKEKLDGLLECSDNDIDSIFD